MFKKLFFGTSLYFLLTTLASAACYPRCWSGEELLPKFDPETVVGKAYQFGLEGHLAPNSDNIYGSDMHLYHMRDLMMFDFRLSSIASRSYQFLWPNVNINQFNAHIYSDALADAIDVGVQFLSAVDGVNSDSTYYTQPVITEALAAKIQSVINQNKGINSSLDLLLHDMEKELNNAKGLKPVELMNYMNLNTNIY